MFILQRIPTEFFFTWKSFVNFSGFSNLESDFFLILQKKCGKKSDSSLKIRKKFTKDFHVKKKSVGILCKMNIGPNYMEFFCKFFCWRSLINLKGNFFIKYKRGNFTKDFLVKNYFHGNSF